MAVIPAKPYSANIVIELSAPNIEANIASLLQKPLRRGIPARDPAAIVIAMKVNRIFLRKPPISSIYLVCVAWIIAPAPINSAALKIA